MELELNYLSDKISEVEEEIYYFENQSRKSENTYLGKYWTDCIVNRTSQLKLLNNIISVVTEHELKNLNQ